MSGRGRAVVRRYRVGRRDGVAERAWERPARENLAGIAGDRMMIEKEGGGERPLGIPTIRDRVAQTAVKLIREPIFEADLEPNMYGYRPKRSAQDAIQEVDKLLYQGYTDVVDADLSKYFDTIPHSELMQCVARRVVDKHMLHLEDVAEAPTRGSRRADRAGRGNGEREEEVNWWKG
jgi:reverse transcriptase-like protein